MLSYKNSLLERILLHKGTFFVLNASCGPILIDLLSVIRG